MSVSIIGQKCGMTRCFDEQGKATAVTIVLCHPNRVTQIKTNEKDGYEAVQVAVGQGHSARVNMPTKGHYAKAGVGLGTSLHELPFASNELTVGAEIQVEVFAQGDWVDVVGTSKGRGFAGVVKRHNFRTQDMSHGNSLSHRAPGSIGQNQTPGRVFKGKKMAGHMGDEQVTIQNLKVVKVDAERHLLWIQGAIPGAKTGLVCIQSAVKMNQGASK